ncbi:MAG: nicotinate-nucleotide adenylyltransferase [Gemmataceae bacterium]|nr:nicotinate-nucleotide adenylyltransferase [Gemmataceae bacterium]MDW8266606.1 nicotinate-nucleotide adenylyltransferase [Gemmataceae bacterium]
MRRIGIFGGTFDPVHLGHLVMAEQCREQAQLDEVWFIPAARPPHKRNQPITSFRQRVEMLALALASNAAFRVEEVEKDRPGPSYTVDTLAEIRQRFPDAELHLVIGADSVADLPLWYQPIRLIQQAILLVFPRYGSPRFDAESLRAALRAPPEVSLRYQEIDAPIIGISGREIRRRVFQGRSIRYWVPAAVEAYIHQHRLYKDHPPEA